ncbi:SMP-30/gluconolactonase/LRE family protein [Sunxiuqinia sp. A32]|uniref:SMP-30/gluconolactonase/LRE family protein n=1 Tax=Sunxiuqinia sp. A32 TaxID=3461496 RepID=UPI0040455599
MKKIKVHYLFSFFLIFVSGTAISQSNSSLKNILKKDAEITMIQTGFSFTEGPAVAPDGRIFFTDQPNDRIYIWNENDEITEFDVDGERSNGLYFGIDGELISCADYRNKLIKIDMNGTKTVLVDNYKDMHLNGPNDLWQHPNGNIYFTDSYYHRPWWPEGQKQVQDERAVYCYTTDGNLIRVADGYKMPNGIIGSPDGKNLYVADINDGKTWKYNIQADGTLTDKTFFAPEGSDGMTIDKKGNVYLTNNGVSIFDKSGSKVGVIEVPERPANVCFGGKKRNILFITARKSVYKIETKVKGVQ